MTHWSVFGQAVILFLIQIGGMGVVTAALSLAFISGRRIGFMQRSVMQEAISAPQVGGIVRLTRFIILTSLGIETLGALLLMPALVPELGWGKGIWYAVFHSVSAFCNAGFDLMGIHGEFSSLTGYAQNALVNIVLVLLITIGGIGFLVWNDVKEHRHHLKQYRLQSKIVLSASGMIKAFLSAETRGLSVCRFLIDHTDRLHVFAVRADHVVRAGLVLKHAAAARTFVDTNHIPPSFRLLVRHDDFRHLLGFVVVFFVPVAPVAVA